MSKVVAVVLAGGTGERVGLAIPKQLIKVAGKPVMEHTIGLFQEASRVDEVFVLMHPDHLEDAERIAAKYPKVVRVLPGGRTRNDSSKAALAALEDYPPDTKVMFHDAVRPLLAEQIINNQIDALDEFNAVDVAIPSADTIIRISATRKIKKVPNRARTWRGQTPQAFRLGTIRKAYDLAWQDPTFAATDDCTVVLRYLPGEPITVVEGAERNMKITKPIDVYLADRLFQLGSLPVQRATDPAWYRSRLADKVLVVIGGSAGIGADIARLAKGFGAKVHTFSRSTTDTHVEREADVVSCLEQVHAAEGRIDAVIVAAGLLAIGELADTPTHDVVEAIGVNYVGPVLVARNAYKYLAETQGRLLFFTSSSYTRGRAGYALYSSSKAAVVNLTQALADEWSEAGVRVNCINPERTATPMRRNAFGSEPADTLLASDEVALVSLHVLMSTQTGSVIDVRKSDDVLGDEAAPA